MITLTFDPTKWRLVPVEPTEEMADAWAAAPAPETIEGIDENYAYAYADWKAMLSAAPQPEPVEAGNAEITAILKRPYHWRIVPEEDGTYFASIIEFPGCIATGETLQHAITVLHDVAESWLLATIDNGQEIPEPSSDPIAAAVRAENEACAKAVEAEIISQHDIDGDENGWDYGYNSGLGDAAQAIRARREGK